MYKQTAAAMESSNIEPPNESNHPPCPQLLFSSLPEDIVVSCLARISKSYYPKLCLVSKNFRSLVLSKEIRKVRTQLKTREECVYLGLKLCSRPCLIWFSLWIKPDHRTLTQCTIQEKSTGNLLVPVPSSYSHLPPNLLCIRVGSEFYKFGTQNSCPSSVVWVFNKLAGKWREAPSMIMARKEKDALMCVRGGKIYVMGGCEEYESLNWAEVFDPKTQTWEPLPDPGSKVRYSSSKKLVLMPGENIYVRTASKARNFAYLVKENKWQVGLNCLSENCLHDNTLPGDFVPETCCVIGNLMYSYGHEKCWWYDTTSKEWRLINGLARLDEFDKTETECCTHGGKLVIFWTSLTFCPIGINKHIWCAVILLDKRLNGEVWGQIEWVDFVRKLPVTYTLGRCANLLL